MSWGHTWLPTKVTDMNRKVQFLLYNMPENSGKVQVVIKDETIWCTPKAMAQLFGVDVPAVSKHLKNIFEEEELLQDMTISKMETVKMLYLIRCTSQETLRPSCQP